MNSTVSVPAQAHTSTNHSSTKCEWVGSDMMQENVQAYVKFTDSLHCNICVFDHSEHHWDVCDCSLCVYAVSVCVSVILQRNAEVCV